MDEDDQDYYYYNCNDSMQNEKYSGTLSSGFDPSIYQTRYKRVNYGPKYYFGQ
jgi:hypothetical protein